MRTYSHAAISYAALRFSGVRRQALLAALGTILPDVPAGVGGLWLWLRKRTFSREDFDDEVRARSVFREPDAGLHSLPVPTAAFLLSRIFSGGRDADSFLAGWAGHVLTDFPTHASDARPIESPVSYREKRRHGRSFTMFEHAVVAAVLLHLAAARQRSPSASPILPLRRR